MTCAHLKRVSLGLTLVVFGSTVVLTEPRWTRAGTVDHPDSTNSPGPDQRTTAIPDSIRNVEHAIDIVHVAVNGHEVTSSEYDIDSFVITETGPLTREPFFDGSYGSLGVFIQKGYIYAATPFESGGDGWLEEYKCKLSALDEHRMSIWVDDQDYKLNSEPESWYIQIRTVDSAKSVEFNLDGMVGSIEGPMVDRLTLAVRGAHNLVNAVEALKYMIRLARYGTPYRFD